jgi:hypothetical protein
MQIAAAAGEAMLKTEPYDQTARETLAEKARADIEKLLTDDQRAVLTKAMTDPRTTTLTDDGKMTEEQKSAAMEKAMAAGQVSTVQSQVDKDGKATMTITYAPLTFPPGPRPPGALRDSDRPPCTRR